MGLRNERPAKRGSAPRAQFRSSSSQAAHLQYHEERQPTSQVTLLDKWRLLQACLVDDTLCSTAKNLFGLLLDHLNSRTGQCNPSIARLASLLSLSRHAIMRSLAELESRGWVEADRKQGRRTDYELCFDRPEARHLVSERPEAGCENATGPEPAAPSTGRENATGGSCRNATRIQEENKKYISHLVDAGPGLIPLESQPPPAAQSEIELPSDIGETFDQFWQTFPKKEGRAAALREWTAARAAAVPASLLVSGAKRYARKCATREARWIASPANWLRGQRWLDDEADRFSRAAPATPPPDDEITRAVREAKAPRDETTWVFIQEGSPEWTRWRGAFAYARAPLETGVRRLVQAETGALERRLGRYFPTPLPPSIEATSHG